MQNILFVLEIAAIFFLMSKGCISVLLWVMSLILFQMSYEKGNEHIYLEAIEDYPVQDCVKPKKFRFLYKKLNKLSYKGIPKEMYYCETIKVYGFIIYSISAFVMLFIDIQKKCESGELTSKAMDLRGLLDAISLMRIGIPVRDALDLGVTNKIFDSYEQALLSDVMNARIPMKLKASEVFDG